MTTPNATDLEADTQQEESTEGAEKQEPPDVATLLKERDELRATLAKVQNDLRSREGQRRKQSEVDSQLADIQDEVKAMRRVTTAVFREMSQRGETDDLSGKVAEIERDASQSRASRLNQNRYDQAVARLMGVVNDKDGNLLLTEAQSKEIQGSWTKSGKEAIETGDFSGLYDITVEASKLVMQNEREASKKEADRLKKETKEQVKKQLEAAGVHDMDTGPSSGGGGTRDGLSGRELIERGLRAKSKVVTG